MPAVFTPGPNIMTSKFELVEKVGLVFYSAPGPRVGSDLTQIGNEHILLLGK